MKIKYSIKEIKRTLHLKVPWSAVLVYDPLSIRLTWLIANFTKITPNQTTILGFLVIIASAYCFFQGTHFYLILGALLCGLATVLDCTDGKIARLKGRESKLGGYLDTIVDALEVFFIVPSLVYGQYLLNKDFSLILIGIFYVFFFSFLISDANPFRLYSNREKNKCIVLPDSIKNKFIGKIRISFSSKRLYLIPEVTDANTLAFFLFPLLMKVKIGLLFGSAILFFDIMVCLYYFLFVEPKVRQ